MFSGKDHWRWRQKMAGELADNIDFERFGIEAIYLAGSTKNTTAGPGSDIDLIIHFTGTEKQRQDLMHWLDGWSACLAAINHHLTGYPVNRLLDIHLITHEDIRHRTSFAVMINSLDNSARLLKKKDTSAHK